MLAKADSPDGLLQPLRSVWPLLANADSSDCQLQLLRSVLLDTSKRQRLITAVNTITDTDTARVRNADGSDCWLRPLRSVLVDTSTRHTTRLIIAITTTADTDTARVVSGDGSDGRPQPPLRSVWPLLVNADGSDGGLRLL